MAGFKIENFIGSLPSKNPIMLPENTAVDSRNQRVESGALDPLCVSRVLKALNAATKFVYRIPNGAENDISQSYWIEFPDRDTDMIRTPVVNDAYERYYWCSPSTGFKYATKASLISGGANNGLNAGVPRPTTPPTLDVLAGTGTTTGNKTTRSYLVTFVSDLAEEGAPGPSAEATGYPNQDWRLRDIPQPVTVAGYTLVTKVRIYRTVTAASGATVFNFMVDLPVGQLIYIDRIPDTIVSGTSELESTTYDPPPPMDGIALMPNGILVGFKKNNLYFSENYKPHAWPAAYTLAVQHEIVGLAVIGTTCVVATKGNPSAVTGNSGAVMTLTSSDTALPCTSRQSIAAAPEGVYYATTDGIVLYGPAGPTIASDDIFGRQYWQANYAAETVDAALFHGTYSAIRTFAGASLGFCIVENSIVQLDTPTVGQAYVGTDIYTNKPWMIVNAVLYDWLPNTGDNRTLTWRSKLFQLPAVVTLSAAQVFFDPAPGAVVRLKVIMRGGRVVLDRQVQTGQINRIKAETKSSFWQIEITSNVRVYSVICAQAVEELKKQ